MTLALAGAVIGLAAASALTRVLEGQLFGVSATDPLTFAVVPLLLLLVAAGACIVPVRRALSVDPATAIRSED
jgi:ABC-type lipoprotein release transport system permease subunit